MGPFLVVKAKHPLYVLQSKKHTNVVHHDRLKKCHDATLPNWLLRERHKLLQAEGQPLKFPPSEIGPLSFNTHESYKEDAISGTPLIDTDVRDQPRENVDPLADLNSTLLYGDDDMPDFRIETDQMEKENTSLGATKQNEEEVVEPDPIQNQTTAAEQKISSRGRPVKTPFRFRDFKLT